MFSIIAPARRVHPARAALLGLAITLGAGTASARAGNLPGSFSGNAYASYANVTAGPLAVGLGQSAYIPCPCQGTAGKVVSNSIAQLAVGTAGGVLKLGAAVSSTKTTKTTSTAEVTDISQITGINLLGGLITADAITAVADVTATSGAISPSAAASTFLNLKVAGLTINANVAPNTVVNLPGLGSLTLRKTVSSHSASSGSMKVEMLSLVVGSSNSYGLPVGVTLVVGHALSGFNRVQPVAVVAGQAYGASAKAVAGSTLSAKLGQVALVTIPCLGTNSKILTNNVNDTSVSGLVSLGASTTTAFGGSQNGGQVARTTATVAGVKLLGGLIGATAITAVAQETVVGGVRTRSTNGTSFADLKVLGLSLPINVTPNTTVTLPLLGRVVLNEQIVPTSGGKTIVNGLHIYVSSVNLLGLPVGTEIVVAHADASAFAFPN